MQRFVLVVLLGLVAVATCQKQSNDLVVGMREPNDALLEQRQVNLHRTLLTITKETVTLEGDGVSRITRVEVIDVKPGNSAEPSLVKGGPGYTFATVSFQSQRNHGIHFLIKIYGKQ